MRPAQRDAFGCSRSPGRSTVTLGYCVRVSLVTCSAYEAARAYLLRKRGIYLVSHVAVTRPLLDHVAITVRGEVVVLAMGHARGEASALGPMAHPRMPKPAGAAISAASRRRGASARATEYWSRCRIRSIDILRAICQNHRALLIGTSVVLAGYPLAIDLRPASWFHERRAVGGTTKSHTGECEQTLLGHSSYVNSAAFSRDGQKIVSASMD
eukprot:COSAG06_NODE_16392_length_1003_cov_74.219027_2_plen_211_part_01